MSKTSPIPTPNAMQRGRASRSALLFLLIGSIATAGVPQPNEQAEESALPLPRWSEHELKAFRNSLPVLNGPGVLPPSSGESTTDINELIRKPLTSGPRLDHFFNEHDSELSPRLQVEDMRLFLPESILGMPVQSQPGGRAQLPTPLAALQDVPAEFLAVCAQSLPREYLIDPEQLVPEIQNHDLMRLLEFHARDARIKLFVLMLDHDQKLPESAELEKIASGSLLQSDACLLVYPLGEPWRTRLFVSRSIHNQISSGFLSETVQACLHESLQTSDVHDQLRRYTIHLSTRLFWLQKALGTAPSQETGTGQALAEFAPASKAPAMLSPAGLMPPAVWSATSVLLLGLTSIAGRQWLRRIRLRRQHRIWMLAEPDTVPRLGGAFTGGGGAMVRYA